MELTLLERIATLNLLPQQGNVVTLRILMSLKKELGFTEEEIKYYGITNKSLPNGNSVIVWDKRFDSETKDIEIGEVARGVISEQLHKLDQQGLLREQALSLWEKFVEGKT